MGIIKKVLEHVVAQRCYDAGYDDGYYSRTRKVKNRGDSEHDEIYDRGFNDGRIQQMIDKGISPYPPSHR